MFIGFLLKEDAVSFVQSIFKNARDYFSVTIMKEELQDPGSLGPPIDEIDILINSLTQGFILQRRDIGWDFVKEYLSENSN